MSDILNYKFYLNFKNTDSFGRLEITEPIGFDGASFIVEQEEKRYGRDAYKINEEINLNFYKGSFDSTNTFQELPNGTVIYNLTQGFEFLIDTYNRWGFEADVDFEIDLNGLLFIPSNLDFVTSETDGFTYLSCKAVQTQAKQLIKRRSDIITDVFSTENLDGNTVTPASTQNILLKAKPIQQISNWEYAPANLNIINFGFQQFCGFPLFNNLVGFGIDDSLVPFDTTYTAQLVNEPSFLEGYRDDISIIKAQSDLTDVKIKIRGLSFTSSGTDTVGTTKQLAVNYGSSYVSGEFEQILLEDTTDDIFNISNNDYDVTIPFVPNGGFIYIHYYMLGLNPSGGGPIGNFGFNLTSGTLEITATSTAIDSVIKGVRYIDVIKANVERVNGFDVDAERYDVNGEYYQQYAFTGQLIKQRDDVAFPVKFNDLMDDLMELNSDYQITDKVYIGQYQDFYTDKEIGAFLTSPDATFKSTFNNRYAINEFEYKYKTYEQDRDEQNTTDAIHTESQWLLDNKQVENTKSVEVGYIRDAYKIESTRKLGLQETTSTTDDDKMFLIDVVPLAPNSKGGFTSVLSHQVQSNNNVKLLRTDLFKWTLLGFAVGSTFDILAGENVGSYTVVDFTDSVLELQPISFVPAFNGETFTQVEYLYNNVSLVNRTDEGLEFFDNLINGDDFSNLRYSIKRNIETWKPYLSTASRFNVDGTFRNTYFKDNGLCITRFTGEDENIQEDADILNTDLGEPLLTPYQYTTRLLVPFSDMVDLLNSIDTINEDKTIAGFVRCVDNNGRVLKLYPSKLDYIPSTETLTLTGEERFENEDLIITIQANTVTINDVAYENDNLREVWYELNGDYLLIYDSNSMPVINPVKFDKVSVDGNIFDSAINLMNYLVNN